jgi:predicted nucleic acid-binding protein
LINFGECAALQVLVDSTAAPRFVVAAVQQELIDPAVRVAVEESIGAGQLTSTDLEPSEMADWARLAQRLGAGESATIAAAIHRGWTVACDDLAARRVVERELGRDRLVGTIGVLLSAVESCVLTRSDGQDLLRRMIENGYWSPVDELPDP